VGRSAGFDRECDVGVRPGRPVCAGSDRARWVGRRWADPLGSRERSGTADRWVIEKPGLLVWCRSVRELGEKWWAGLLGSTLASDLGSRSVLGPTERELGVGWESERRRRSLARASDSDFWLVGRSAGFEGLRERASDIGIGVGVGFPVGGGGHGGEGRFGKWRKF
jgi:hypothetical protein